MGLKLTGQEAKVFDLYLSGFLKPQIASRLGLSTKTVSGHLGIVFEKLNLKGRKNVRAEALRQYGGYCPTCEHVIEVEKRA